MAGPSWRSSTWRSRATSSASEDAGNWGADHVAQAQRVDTPGDVLQQGDADQPGQAGSVPVRRMRVARPVGKGVMTTGDGDLADDLTLEAHRPRDSQHAPQRRRRREAAVGEQPVEADGHPK